MVIRRRLDPQEACRRSKMELGMVEPAGHPKEEEYLSMYIEGSRYIRERIERTSKSDIERYMRRKRKGG